MRQREPVRLGVRADVGQPQRLRIPDQHPEHAAPVRQVADRAVRLLVDPLREELVEHLAALVEHPDRGVPRPRELLGELEQPVEHHVGIQLGHDGPRDVEEAPKAQLVHGSTLPRQESGSGDSTTVRTTDPTAAEPG